MNMSALWRSIFHHEIPPDPPAPKRKLETTEIRWLKAKTAANKRRAAEMQIDVDIKEQGFKE